MRLLLWNDHAPGFASMQLKFSAPQSKLQDIFGGTREGFIGVEAKEGFVMLVHIRVELFKDLRISSACLSVRRDGGENQLLMVQHRRNRTRQKFVS